MKKLNLKTIFFTIFASISFIFLPMAATQAIDVQKEFAETLHEAGLIETAEKGSIATVDSVVNNIIFSVISLAGVIIFLLVIYGGFMWATARGNETQVKQAQQTIVRGIIGLLIIFSAFIISNFVLDALSRAAGA